MTRMFLVVFYSMLLFILYSNGSIFFGEYSDNFEPILFARLVSYFLASPVSLPGFYLIGILSMVACIIWPFFYIRAFASLFFLILLSIKFSYGKINHSEHIWMISSVLMCFISQEYRLSNFKNLLVIRLFQTFLLNIYFLSGVWKIRSLGFSGWGDAALEHLAYSVAEGGGPGRHLEILLTQNYSWLITTSFFLIVLFQISSIVPVITLRYFKIWGFGALFFHLATGIALGIWFHPTVLAVLFILIFAEDLLKWEHELIAD